MPKIIKKYPTQGFYYRIARKGDFLFKVAGRAYGNTRLWPLIWKSSRTKLRSGDPNIPFVGELVFIPKLKPKKPKRGKPADPVVVPQQLTGKGADDFTLILGEREVPVVAARIIRTVDTPADGWTATIAWTPGADLELDDLVKPYSYSDAGVYLGNVLMIGGRLYGTTPSNTTSGSTKDLEGFSSTADIVDSTMRSPYQQSKVTLVERATDLLQRFGLTVEIDLDANTGGQFKRVTSKNTETIFSHLKKLADQRGVLITSTRNGNLLLTQAAVDDVIVDILVEGQDFIIATGANFDGRQRFASYKAVSQGGKKKKKKTAIANDIEVPGARFLTFSANDSSAAEVLRAAKWQRAKQFADALTIPIPVSTWYDKNGDLWEENSLVFIISPTLDLPKGFTFLVKQVEYIFEDSGRTAILSVVPPDVYTGDSFKDPWAKGE